MGEKSLFLVSVKKFACCSSFAILSKKIVGIRILSTPEKKYQSGAYGRSINPFFDDFNVPANMRKNPYYACWDMEARQIPAEDSDAILEALNCGDEVVQCNNTATCTIHIPVSYAISHNCCESREVSTISELVKGPGDGDIKAMVEGLYQNLENLAEESYRLMKEAHSEYLEKAEEMAADNPRLKQRLDDYQQWLKRLTVLGFNSSSYDTALIKSWLFPLLKTKYQDGFTVVKKGSRYSAITTPHCKFLDIMNYTGPGTSLKNFLKHWIDGDDPDDEKLLFPYCWLQKTEQLNQVEFPTIEDFNKGIEDSASNTERLTGQAPRQRTLGEGVCDLERYQI